MANKQFNSVDGYSVGATPNLTIDANANVFSNALAVTANANVTGNLYTGNRVGFANVANANSSIAYTYFNSSTNSIDTVFG